MRLTRCWIIIDFVVVQRFFKILFDKTRSFIHIRERMAARRRSVGKLKMPAGMIDVAKLKPGAYQKHKQQKS